jgi:hypothetical protein
MKRVYALLVALAVGATSMLAAPVHAKERDLSNGPRNKSCHPQALAHLKRLAPQGWAVYEQAADKSFFTNWIDCDQSVVMGVTTAVHETVHMMTEELHAYPLIMGGRLPRISERRTRTFFPPKLTSHQFDAKSGFVETYLKPGAASSAEEFDYLLNEFNAYTHDLHAAIQLQSVASRAQEVYHRDGLAALMAFVAAYVERARTEHPETWRTLQEPQTRRTLAMLWEQAEQVMANSCRTQRIALEATGFLKHVCRADIRHGLGHLLGRPPLCPVTCTRGRSAGEPIEASAGIESEDQASEPPRKRRRSSRGAGDSAAETESATSLGRNWWQHIWSRE